MAKNCKTMKTFQRINNEITSANEILPGLWIGNSFASQDVDFLRPAKIEAVVNCTKDLPFSYRYYNLKERPVQFYRIPIDDPGSNSTWDTNHDTLYEMLPTITKNISHHMKLHEPVLVHCHAGIQRSAAVVLATLIRYGVWKGATMPESIYVGAVNFIIKKRPIAFFAGESVNFEKALLKFASNVKLNLEK